ncbi:MAG: hypothetical protein H0X62_10390 [Bacteroidetes bacterium]|nr:hypothetical protein [Bacteroidota bacterium]
MSNTVLKLEKPAVIDTVEIPGLPANNYAFSRGKLKKTVSYIPFEYDAS